MSRIHLFMNNPTAGSTDGTEISGGDETLPLAFNLNATQSESAVAKCAVRCDSGYSLKGGAEIYFEGTNSDSWFVSPDNNYDNDTAVSFAIWQNSVLLENVADSNVIFWVKAISNSSEVPRNDTSVDIKARGIVVQKGA